MKCQYVWTSTSCVCVCVCCFLLFNFSSFVKKVPCLVVEFILGAVHKHKYLFQSTNFTKWPGPIPPYSVVLKMLITHVLNTTCSVHKVQRHCGVVVRYLSSVREVWGWEQPKADFFLVTKGVVNIFCFENARHSPSTNIKYTDCTKNSNIYGQPLRRFWISVVHHKFECHGFCS